MRYFTLFGSLVVSGLAFAASPDKQAVSGELRTLNLAVEKASSYQDADALILPESLNILELHQGRVRLSGTEGLNLSFEKPLKTFAATLDDPQQDSVYELRWYRDQYELGVQRFAPAALGLPDVRPIIGGRVAIETDEPFDRVELKEIHGRTSGDDEFVSEIQAGLANSNDTQTKNLLAFACQLPLGLAYNVSFAAGLLAIDPVNAKIADYAGYTTNLALKFCDTVLEPPPNLTSRVPDGVCSASLEQEHLVAEYENALGVPLVWEYDWGELGTPLVYHHNTEVEVGAYFGTPTPPDSGTLDLKILLEDLALTADATDLIYEECKADGSVATSQLNGTGKEYACPFVEGRRIDFPVGRNTVLWRANTKVGPLDLVPLSVVLLPAGAKLEPYKRALERILQVASVGADTYLLNGWRWGHVHDAYQTVTIFDEVPPTITPQPVDQSRITTSLVNNVINVQIEADEPGGVSRRNYDRILQRMYAVSDACDRPVTFNPEFPNDALRTFWPVSTASQDNSFTITWKARDPGPNFGDLPNETTTTMHVEVVDIRAPAIVPPPDIVEITSGQVSDLGQPLVFDFVDLDPLITNDASLPLGAGLHEVTWTATDASGNSSQAVQIVNIKDSNTDPAAIALQGANRPDAISFEPTTLRLTGDDPDNDPLRFYIEAFPQDGFFVAPLYPYFVEDYRIERSASDAELTAACTGPGGVGSAPGFDLNFPSEPSYITVNDAGTTFVLDRGYINCSALFRDGFRRDQRIATFDADGGLLNSNTRDIGDNDYSDVIVDQVRALIYATSTSGSGSSFIRILDFDLNVVESFGLNNIRNRDTNRCNPLGPDGPCEIRNARSALIDELGILYVMDNDGLIYGLVKDGNQVKFVDYVTDDVTGGGSFVRADQLAMDSQGNLYASRNNRIYKYRGSEIGGDGQAYPGWLLGWMGRCDTDLAPGDEAVCDVANRRSMGYSCTDELCGITDQATVEEKAFCGFTFTNTGNFGCRPGQFFSPQGIDFDLRDNLYVADGANERIQRFTPDGFFAGEAESACDGSCFVLGDFGNPKDVSVNSGQFYILDPATNLLHVSSLTPFTDIGPDWAELVYQSNNDFACIDSADCIDNFAFSVSDGVRDQDTGLPMRSAPATVEVEVSRNFRPPVATPGLVSVVLEDALTPILLDGAELDPLDSLSFRLFDGPQNGTVNIVGDFARYRPDPDFVGQDSFSFTAFDGLAESAPEILEVTVLNLNDRPQVSPIEDMTAGVGFPFQLSSDFSDPDTGEAHLLVVNWGDGTVEPEGEIDANGEATGPLLDETGIGLGRITADHVYTAPGVRTLEVCVTDQVDDSGVTKLPTVNSLTDCVQAVVDVIDVVDLALGVTPSRETALPGQLLSYDFEVRNLPPAAGNGQIATGVQLEVRLSSYLDESSISIVGAGCTRDAYIVTCNFGTLGVGNTDDLRVTAQVPFDIGPGVMLRTRAEARLNEPDQTPDNSLVQLTPVVNPGDHYVGTTDKAWLDKPDVNPSDGICASEDGVCTLRAAIEQSNATPGLQVIVLGGGVYRLEENLPRVEDDLVILGSGPDVTIIDGTDRGVALNVQPTGSLRIEDLTIANTVGPALNVYGPTTVRRVRFTNNYARSFFGGAILNANHLDLRDVTFDGNRSDNDGGAVWNGSNSTSTMVNVTAVGNINSAFAFTGGTHSLTNVTITGNTGGAFWEENAAALNTYGSNTVVTLTNTALIGNRIGPVGGAPNCSVQTGSQLISGGNNLFGDLAGCNISLQPSDLQATDALLLPAANNGGGMLTMKPRPGSPLIDNGSASACPGSDARGVSRPEDGNGDEVARCDIGAFELRSNMMFSDGFE